MQTPDQSKSERAPKRGAEGGNRIWALYRGLNWNQAKAFREQLTAWNIPFATFNKQSKASRPLGSVPTKNFHLYRDYFFKATGNDLLVDLSDESPELQ